jgi:glycosyltransferase involved in cell wall biosynthesis
MKHGKKSIFAVINQAEMGGGMGHLLGLFKHLDRERYYLSLAADRGDYLVEPIRKLGVGVHFLPMMRSRFDLAAARRIARVARMEGADLLHLHGTRAAFFGGLARKMLPETKTVYTVHGFSFHKELDFARERFYLGLERLLGKWHDRLISVCESDRSEAVRRHVCRSTRIETIPNAIDLDSFDPSQVNGAFRGSLGINNGTRLVGTAGRWVSQKGIEHFLSGAALIREKHSDVKFVIVGEGKLESKLKEQADKTGLSDAVVFAGPRSRMADVYNGLNVFVLASLWEGQPLSLIESLAMETPTVATRTAGNPEIVAHEQTGLLVPPRDPEGIADAVVRMLDNPEWARTLGKRGRKAMLSRCSLANMARKTQAVYEELLTSKSLGDAH